MKNIKQILAIAILGIFAVACTDEDALTNDSKANTKTTVSSSYDQRDHTYESKDYTEDEAFAMMQKFDSLMRGEGLSTSEYDINEALFAMEFYYNYAVVDKQKDYDTASYDGQTFTFTLDLNSKGNIDVDVLREKYTTFLNYVITSMGDKYLQYSDLYVSEKTSNSIIIGLEVLPYSSIHRFRNSIIKENPPTDIVVVGSASTHWIYSNSSTGQTDQMVRSLCKKQVNNCFFYIINTHVPSASSLLPGGTFNIYSASASTSNFYFNGNTLRDQLVYPTIAKAHTYSGVIRKPIDVMPTVYFELDPVTGKLGTGYMSLKEWQTAQIIYFTLPNSFHDFVTNNLIFPIQ